MCCFESFEQTRYLGRSLGLLPGSESLHYLHWQGIHRIDAPEALVSHQRQRSHAEEGVKSIHRILWPVRDAAILFILQRRWKLDSCRATLKPFVQCQSGYHPTESSMQVHVATLALHKGAYTDVRSAGSQAGHFAVAYA